MRLVVLSEEGNGVAVLACAPCATYTMDIVFDSEGELFSGVQC